MPFNLDKKSPINYFEGLEKSYQNFFHPNLIYHQSRNDSLLSLNDLWQKDLNETECIEEREKPKYNENISFVRP